MNTEKKQFERPELELIKLTANDVIATSGEFNDSGYQPFGNAE